MKDYSLQQRADFYNNAFPKRVKVFVDKGWIVGSWSIGNCYKNDSSLYGSYPHSYLERILSMFPDAERILYLFSGSLQNVKGVRFDIDPKKKPDVVGDAHFLSKYFEPDEFDMILSDCPYSAEDALHYGTPMIKRNIVVKECMKVLEPGGWLNWLDQVLPMYSNKIIKRRGEIGLTQSTNHRVRETFMFERLG